MTYRGRIKDGVVQLDDPKALPEGTEVTVQPVKTKPKPAKGKKKLRQGLLKFAGKAKGLPADASRNIDHYLYGHSKR